MVVNAKGMSVAGILAMLALSCLAASALAATGLEPGVHVDPGSPAAKEYALPLNQARQTGASTSGNASTGSAALFGAGIKPPGSGGSGRPRSATPHGVRRDASGAASSDPRTSVPAIVLRAASSHTSSGGDGSLLTLLGGAVAILILGAFGGTIMRRSHRPVHPS